MTKKEMYMAIREAVIDNEEMVTFIDRQIELLNKKSNSARKPTERQIENEQFKADILNHLATADTMKSIKELQADILSISKLSNQRITHMLTALVKDGKLTKEYVKRVPYFYLTV